MNIMFSGQTFMTEETSSDSLKTSSSRMAGPDNQEPVTASGLMDSKEIPVKASPPREKSPSLTDVVTTSDPGAPGSSVPPPDGGWGWAVVFASFMIHIIGNNCTKLYYILCTLEQSYFFPIASTIILVVIFC